jgi:hypothetical protein
MKFILSRLSPIVVVALLTACGGGGGGSNTAATAPTPPASTVVDPVSQTVQLVVPSFMGPSDTLRMVSSYTGEDSLNSTADTVIDRYEVDELVTVINQSDQVALLGYFFAGTRTQELSPTSTALVLVAIFPSLSSTYNENPVAFIDTIKTYQEVQALASAIDVTADWSLGDDTVFISAYADAVRRVYSAIQSGAIAGGASTQALTGKSSAAGKVRVAEGSEATLSGVSIELSGEESQILDPRFELDTYNALSRYVTIVVGSEPHGALAGDAPRMFLVPPHDEERYLSYFSELLDDGNTIHAYGPANQGTLDGLLQSAVVEQNAYANASLASIIAYQVIPTLRARYQIKTACLMDKWFLEDSLGLKGLAPLFANDLGRYRSLILEGNFFTPGLLATYIVDSGLGYLSINRNPDLKACISEVAFENIVDGANEGLGDAIVSLIESAISSSFKYGTLYNKLFALVGDALTVEGTLNKIYMIDPGFEAALGLARKSEYWDITNTQPYDQSNFAIEVSSASDTAPFADEFTTECPPETLCASFKYPRVRPVVDFSAAFTVRCVDDLGVNQLCRNTVADFGDGNYAGGTKEDLDEPLNGDTTYFENVIEHTYVNNDRDVPGSVTHYVGTISAADYDGAYTDFDFQLDLGEAQPEMRVSVGTNVYEAGAIIDEIFLCVTVGVSVSKRITVGNLGRGTLYWSTPIPTIAVGAGWSFSGLESRTVEFGQTVEGVLTYDCATTAVQGHTWKDTFGDTYATGFNQDVSFSVTYTPPENSFGTYTVCYTGEYEVLGCSAGALRIEEGVPGDGIGHLSYASHINLQNRPVDMGDQDTSISASGESTIPRFNITCDDGISRSFDIAWSTMFSADLTGDSGNLTETYDYPTGCGTDTRTTATFYVVPD